MRLNILLLPTCSVTVAIFFNFAVAGQSRASSPALSDTITSSSSELTAIASRYGSVWPLKATSTVTGTIALAADATMSVAPANLHGRADSSESTGSSTAANSGKPVSPAALGLQMCAPATNSTEAISEYLNTTLEESGMTLHRPPDLVSPPGDPNRAFCDIFAANSSGAFGHTFPRCLMMTAVDDFCTIDDSNGKVNVGDSTPDQTDKKGGRWITYHFNVTNFLQGGWTLYVGLEKDRRDECQQHMRPLFDYDGQPDPHCKDRLMGEIVDRCETDSKVSKRGGVRLEFCEVWAIYPLPPLHNATKGTTSVLHQPTDGSYPLCESSPISALSITPPARTSTASSQSAGSSASGVESAASSETNSSGSITASSSSTSSDASANQSKSSSSSTAEDAANSSSGTDSSEPTSDSSHTQQARRRQAVREITW